jgi:hypothetical protein
MQPSRQSGVQAIASIANIRIRALSELRLSIIASYCEPTSSGSNRFAIDSSLEGDGFEPSVPRGETDVWHPVRPLQDKNAGWSSMVEAPRTAR